jgi:aspartate/methionine/tyrosine aminotransferase
MKRRAIDRLLSQNPSLSERRFGLPAIGTRLDGEGFNNNVQEIADAIDFYGFKVRDDDIVSIPDTNLGSGNPLKIYPFPPAKKAMLDSINNDYMHAYPYTEGDDNLRKILLDYIEDEGFINDEPYSYDDVDEKGLSIHNLTFLPSTSIAFNLIINIIAKPGDVVLITGPNYGLFTIRAERAGAEVEIIPLEKEDDYLINPIKLAKKIDDINSSLENVYHKRRAYVPRVVSFLNTNPNNPTGKVMGVKEKDLLLKIGNVCNERGVFIIDDLVYRDITFDENNLALPLATLPGMFKNTISLFSLSKSYGMASLRAGLVVADEVIIRELINRVFQSMDSSPDIVGRALVGAYNASLERKEAYKVYFKKVRETYSKRFNLLKALVLGLDSLTSYKTEIENVLKNYLSLDEMDTPMPYTKIPIIPESGFFAILDFTDLKGLKYEGKPIITEEDLLKFFYKTCRIRFLVGQSISWPDRFALIGRVNFALEEDELIKAFLMMKKALFKLK